MLLLAAYRLTVPVEVVSADALASTGGALPTALVCYACEKAEKMVQLVCERYLYVPVVGPYSQAWETTKDKSQAPINWQCTEPLHGSVCYGLF